LSDLLLLRLELYLVIIKIIIIKFELMTHISCDGVMTDESACRFTCPTAVAS